MVNLNMSKIFYAVRFLSSDGSKVVGDIVLMFNDEPSIDEVISILNHSMFEVTPISLTMISDRGFDFSGKFISSDELKKAKALEKIKAILTSEEIKLLGLTL